MDSIAIVAILLVIGGFIYSFLRKAPLSLTIAVAALAVYALLTITSRGLTSPYWSPGYADLVLRSGIWRSEEIPKFFTTMFVHQNLLHLGFNVIALIFIGMPLEERIGSAAFAFIFIVGGIVGSLAFYLIHYADVIFVLGASGAISAELGAFARLYPRQRVTIFFPLVPIPAIPVIWLAIGFLLLSALLVYVIPGVAHEAHMAGVVAGLFLAPIAIRFKSSRQRRILTDFNQLEFLATTPELRNILDTIRMEKITDIREAWIGRFFELAKCPRCQGPLVRRNKNIVSDCGWKLRLR